MTESTKFERSLSRWWGWGIRPIKFDINHRGPLLEYLRERLGVTDLVPYREFDIQKVRIPESKLPGESLGLLARDLGNQAASVIDQTHEGRVGHALGKSYRDLVRLRSGELLEAPDVVFYPTCEEHVHLIVKWCIAHRVALIPFGGGTSVVGGIEANRGGLPYLACLDMTRMNRVLDVDPISQTAWVEAGIFGPDLERELGGQGYTLGHFPQSFEFSTVGGWVAARSAGQNSILYGGIERLTVALRVVTPQGVIETLASPAHACGPDTKEILTGSEGVCGVITKVLLRIRKVPIEKDYFLILFSSYWAAAEASRHWVQSGFSPAMIRISDEEETAASLAMGSSEKHGWAKIVNEAGKKILAYRGYDLGKPLSAVMVGLEGDPLEVQAQKKWLLQIIKSQGGYCLGSAPGKKWLKDRFFLPYLRDELMDQNLFVETLETVTEWSQLEKLYRTVRESLVGEAERQGVKHVVYCHVSHLYRDGASLYFTIIAQAQVNREIEQWNGFKLAANRAIHSVRGGISHHHGVGEDHREFLHWSEAERTLMRDLKKSLDPSGIMNPGKLV